MSEILKGYVNVNEAARRLDRSTEQVRRYLREGKLAGRRIGGQWFINESAVLYLVRGEKADSGENMMYYEETKKGVWGYKTREEAFDSISRRREAIRKRWDKSGVRLNIVDLIREIREENV